jgi:hypothetical protein
MNSTLGKHTPGRRYTDGLIIQVHIHTSKGYEN